MGCGPSKGPLSQVAKPASTTGETTLGAVSKDPCRDDHPTDDHSGDAHTVPPRTSSLSRTGKALALRTQAGIDRSRNLARMEASETKSRAKGERPAPRQAKHLHFDDEPEPNTPEEASVDRRDDSSAETKPFTNGSASASETEPGDSSVEPSSSVPPSLLAVGPPSAKKRSYDPARHEALLTNVVGTGALVVGQVFLPCGMAEFRRLFWTGEVGVGGAGFYRDFVGLSLGDDEIEVSSWEPSKEVVAGTALNAICRTITSKHPLALSFPGMPSRVNATKNQVATSIGEDEMLVVDTSSFEGIPYSDHFFVVTRWVIMGHERSGGGSGGAAGRGGGPKPASASSSSAVFGFGGATGGSGGNNYEGGNEGGGGGVVEEVEVQIACEVVFRKSTMLEKRITANTVFELGKTYESWGALAKSFLSLRRAEQGDASAASPAGSGGSRASLLPAAGSDPKAEATERAMANDDAPGEDEVCGGGAAHVVLADMAVDSGMAGHMRDAALSSVPATFEAHTAKKAPPKKPPAASDGGMMSRSRHGGESPRSPKPAAKATLPSSSSPPPLMQSGGAGGGGGDEINGGDDDEEEETPEEVAARAAAEADAAAAGLVAKRAALALHAKLSAKYQAQALEDSPSLVDRLVQRARPLKKTLSPYFVLRVDLDATAADVEDRSDALLRLVKAYVPPSGSSPEVARAEAKDRAEAVGLIKDARAEVGATIASDVAKAEARARLQSLRASMARLDKEAAAARNRKRLAAGSSNPAAVAGASPVKQRKPPPVKPGKGSAAAAAAAASSGGSGSSAMAQSWSNPLAAVGSGLDSVRLTTEAAWASTQQALADPNDPSSRRVLGGAAGGFVAGTILTLNPVGGLVGAIIGSGLGAGVNELERSGDEDRRKAAAAESSLADLPGYRRRMRVVEQAVEDQGALPQASAAAAGAARRRFGATKASRGGGASGSGGGSEPGSPDFDPTAAAAGTSKQASPTGAGSGGEGGGSREDEDAMGASDLLIFSVVAGGATATAVGEEAARLAEEQPPEHAGPRPADEGAAPHTPHQREQQQQQQHGGAAVARPLRSASHASERETLDSPQQLERPGQGAAAGGSSLLSYFTFGVLAGEAGSLRSPTQTAQTNLITGRKYLVYSGNSAKARPGSLGRDDAGLKRWAIWTRETFEVHRYPYASEAEARRDYARWVYVRILTDPSHAEVKVDNGWHAAPLIPLTDIRAAIAANM